MTWSFAILAVLTLAGAVGAMSLRNLVHGLLCLVGSFLGLAGLYLQLSAVFVGLVQVLVYVGAVAVLVVFAIVFTRGGVEGRPLAAAGWVTGVGVAGLVTAGLLAAMPGPAAQAGPVVVTVRDIGMKLMTEYVLPLEVAGLLLTAALLGGALLAMPERGKDDDGGKPGREDA